MATLKRYPLLRSLLEDLTRLSVDEAARAAGERRARGVTIKEGRDTTLVSLPWVGQFWLTGPQRDVVRALLDAYVNARDPDVSQAALLSLAKSKALRLEELFAGSEAWGTLIVKGRRACSYRIAPVPEGGGAEEEPEVRYEAEE